MEDLFIETTDAHMYTLEIKDFIWRILHCYGNSYYDLKKINKKDSTTIQKTLFYH